ncbi:Ornithine carbamoyltransferase protein, partial [Halorhabdus tiamatea SARL4B]
DAAGVYAIHDAMARLDDHVVEALQDAGVPALPVHPFSVASRDEHGETALPTGAIDRLRGEGFVPVLFGDVVVQAGAGATILSGDEIVVLLARSLGADRIGLCSGVSGVLDESGAVIDRIEDFAAVADALGESEATDVTGGMAGKVRALLDLETPASIFGPDDLAAFLAGEDPGTLIE